MTVLEDSPINRMFKWLKDKKKTKREGQADKNEDEYGFQKGQRGERDEYGFNNCVNMNMLKRHGHKIISNDPTFHIYEEILDLPEANSPARKVPVIGSTNGAFRRIESQNTRNNAPMLPASYSRRSLPVPEGPYMVVPIVNKTVSDKSEQDFCKECRVSNVNTSVNCACPIQKLTFEPSYNAPWDSKNESALNKSRTDGTSFRVLNPKCRSQQSGSLPDYVTSSSSECSSGSGSTGSSSAGNDTGYEYDINTSSESDAIDSTDYKCVLEKVQHNLMLKEQVRNIIHSTEGEFTSDSSNTTLDRTSCSIRTISSLSGRSSAPTISNSFVSDHGSLADNSESDDSGGDFECPGSNDTSSGTTSVNSDLYNSKGDNSQRARRNRIKHTRNHHQRHSSLKRNEKDKKCRGTMIAEDTELYLLPANKKESCSNIRVFGNPMVPPQQTLIYQDPQRQPSKAGNRLLSDLIRMNYDKQHMFHV